jgi:uncharacterized ion transporter superfamily protein YfcC
MHTVSNFVNNSFQKKKKKKKKKEKKKKKSNNIKGQKNICFLLSFGCVDILFSVYRLGKNECRTEQVRR